MGRNGNPRTIGEMLDILRDHLKAQLPPAQFDNAWRELLTALLRYVVFALGFKRQDPSRRMTALERKAAMTFLRHVSIKRLPEFPALAEQAFQALDVSQAVRQTYGGRVRQMLEIAQQQVWYPSYRLTQSFRDECASQLPKKYGRTSDTKLMPQKRKTPSYVLLPDEITPSLQAELDDLYRFCCSEFYPDRVIGTCSDTTADNYLYQIKLLLGWHLRYYAPNLTPVDLSLKLLVPFVDDSELEGLNIQQQRKLWRPYQNYVKAWMAEHFQFLSEVMGSYSPKTRQQRLIVLSKIAHWLYTGSVDTTAEYARIPLIATIKDLQAEVRREEVAWKSQNRYAADQSKKWPDTKPGQTALSALREGLLVQLLQRCRPRNSSGAFHEPKPQARFLAAYLIWFELAFEPPRRQQEFRTRRVALACPIQRPDTVPPDGLYHPLPPDAVRARRRDGRMVDNYMYRTYRHQGLDYPEGIWVRQVTAYKTDRSYGTQDIVLRNRPVGTGQMLYDLWESYLYGQWYTSSVKHSTTYDWWDPTLKGQRGFWLTLGVMTFEPHRHEVSDEQAGDWPWMPCFPVPKTGKAYTRDGMSDMIQRAAHEWTGKRTTPHLMRRIWGTWALQVGLDDVVVHSLAYAMGTSYQTLKEWYEEATAEDKRKAIEEHIDEYFMGCLEDLGEQDPCAPQLRKVLQLIPQLSPEERRAVQDLLNGDS